MKFNIGSDIHTLPIHVEGIFEVSGNFLFIEAQEFMGIRSSILATEKKGDFSEITIVEPNGTPVEDAKIYLWDTLSKFSCEMWTNELGKASIFSSNRARMLRVRVVHSYDRLIATDFNPNFDYKVTLVVAEVMENRTIVFHIHSLNSNAITLSWFTDNLKESRNLKKFDRLARKLQRRPFRTPIQRRRHIKRRPRQFKKITVVNTSG
ncbi:MAG: hypothetical protein JKX84_04940 [Flavobacteriales bacterium]|nr:hypothetical protein [Flavobacteriales bacterium]